MYLYITERDEHAAILKKMYCLKKYVKFILVSQKLSERIRYNIT